MYKKVKKITKATVGVGPSKIFKGEVGVIALCDLRKGEIFGRVDSPEKVVMVSRKDFLKLDPTTRERIMGFCPCTDDFFCVPQDLNNMGTSWYHNHSCSPNAGYDIHGNHVAIKNIKKGEEIFIDYGFFFEDPKFKMICKCGSKDCRKIITGKDWLDPEFRKKNLLYMWPWMRKSPKKIKSK